MKDEALKLAREIVAHANGIDGHDYSHVLNKIDAALAQPEQRKSLTKDYTAEDLQNALDRGREIGRSEGKPFNHHEFGYWWFEYGSGLRPLEGEDQEQHAYRVASEAWKAANGIKENT